MSPRKIWPVVVLLLMTGGVTTAQENEGDPHSRVQVKLEVLDLHDALPGAESNSIVAVGGRFGKDTTTEKDKSGKLLYLRTIDGQSRWLPGNAIEITLEITENDVKRTETVLLEGFEPKTLVLREDPAHGRRELLRLIPVSGPLDKSHAPVMGANPREPLDPEAREFRLVSPFLVCDNQVLVNIAGSATATENDPAASVYSPGLGRFIFSSVPFEGAIEGTLRSNQINFTLEGKSYLLLTGAPISVSQNVWVVHQPFWRPSASELSALGDHPILATSSLRALLDSR